MIWGFYVMSDLEGYSGFAMDSVGIVLRQPNPDHAILGRVSGSNRYCGSGFQPELSHCHIQIDIYF